VAPETIAAIDNHHFGQKTTLAMTDYYHLAKRRVLSLGIDVPSHRLERLAQPHRRQDDGIAAVVNEEPDLKARGYCGVAKQLVCHLGPPRRTRGGPVNKDHGYQPGKVGMQHIQTAVTCVAIAEKRKVSFAKAGKLEIPDR